VRGTNSEGEGGGGGNGGGGGGGAPFGPEIMGRKWKEVTLTPSDSGAWKSVVSSLSGVRGVAQAENGFIVI